MDIYGKGLYYNDSVSVASQGRAQDIVTLTVGIPFLIVSLIFANKRSLRGKLLLTGALGYFLYTYMSYSFLAMYNNFFLIYIMMISDIQIKWHWMIWSSINNELERCVEWLLPHLSVYPSIYLGTQKKTTENLIHDNQFTSRNMNHGSPENKSGNLQLH